MVEGDAFRKRIRGHRTGKGKSGQDGKPDSVRRPRGRVATIHLTRPIPGTVLSRGAGSASFPIWSCTGRGLPSRRSLRAGAVGSCPAFFTLADDFHHRRYVLCCAILTAGSPCDTWSFNQASCPVVSGLSSPACVGAAACRCPRG